MGNLKNKTEKEFILHTPEIGRFDGGTQPPVYLDKKGNKVPYKKTKWYQFKKRKEWQAKTY